jgi:hypothetical protein
MPTQVSDQFREQLLISVVTALVREHANTQDQPSWIDVAGEAEILVEAVIAREERRLTKDSLAFVDQALSAFNDLTEKKEWRKAGVLLALFKQGLSATCSAPLQVVNAALLGLMQGKSPGSIGSEEVATVLEMFTNAKRQLEADLGIPQ